MRLSRGERIVLATHNPGKVAEFEALLAPFGLEAVAAGALGLPAPAETAEDFFGNARIKAVAAAREAGMPALADDSGFCVAALGGAPGVLSARWAAEAGGFEGAMARIGRELGEDADRRAWFVCALSMAWPDGRTATFQGRVEGAVRLPPAGRHGFGYDPIFVPAGSRQSFGEMLPAEKDAISHRARAFAQLASAVLPARLTD